MTAGDNRCRPGRTPTAQRSGLESAINNSAARRSTDRDIVEHRVGRVTDVIIVVTEEGQGVAVATDEVGRNLDPSAIGCANSRQQRCRGAGGVIAQRRRRPIIGDDIRAGHLVPKRELSARCRRNESLGDGRVAVGRIGAANASGIGAAVTSGHNRCGSG